MKQPTKLPVFIAAVVLVLGPAGCSEKVESDAAPKAVPAADSTAPAGVASIQKSSLVDRELTPEEVKQLKELGSQMATFANGITPVIEQLAGQAVMSSHKIQIEREARGYIGRFRRFPERGRKKYLSCSKAVEIVVAVAPDLDRQDGDGNFAYTFAQNKRKLRQHAEECVELANAESDYVRSQRGK